MARSRLKPGLCGGDPVEGVGGEAAAGVVVRDVVADGGEGARVEEEDAPEFAVSPVVTGAVLFWGSLLRAAGGGKPLHAVPM